MTATELKPVAWTKQSSIDALGSDEEAEVEVWATSGGFATVPLILKSEADTTIADLRAEVERLREVLLPFEVIANHPFLEGVVSDRTTILLKDMQDDYVGSLRVRDFRRARAALQKEGTT